MVLRRTVLEEAALIIEACPNEFTKYELVAILRAAKEKRPYNLELYGDDDAPYHRMGIESWQPIELIAHNWEPPPVRRSLLSRMLGFIV